MIKTDSYKRGILFSIAGNMLSRFLFFLQGVMIAYYYGTASKTDIYFYTISIITLITYIINTLDSYVLIPESMRLREQEGKETSMKFLNMFLYAYIFIGMLCTLFCFIDPVKIFFIISRFDYSDLSSNSRIFFLSIPLMLLMIVTNLMGSILASYKYFTIPSMVSALNNFLALLFLILLHDEFDIQSILFGLIGGYSFNFFILIYLMGAKIGWRFSFSYYKIDKNVFRNIFYSHTGNIVSLFSSYIPIYILSGFGKGVIAALNYGQKTAEVPNQLLTMQFSSVLGIKFNELFAKKDYEGLNKIFISSSNALLFVLVPVSGYMFLFSEEIISFFFARGAFNEADVKSSVVYFKCFVLILPLYAHNTVMARLFMAGQKIKESCWNQIAFNVAIIGLSIAGIKIFGGQGYPMAVLMVYIINIFTSKVWANYLFPFIRYSSMLASMAIIYLMNGLIGSGLHFIKHHLPFSDVLNLLTGCVMYAGLILFINKILGINKDIILHIKELVSSFTRKK